MGISTLLMVVLVQGDGLFDECRAELMKELGDSMANRPLPIGDGAGGLLGVILPDGRVASPANDGSPGTMAAEVQQALAASTPVAAVAAAGPTIIDDFNRADSAVLGAATNGLVWVETEPPASTVTLVGGRAVLDSGAGAVFPYPSAGMPVGNLATFDIQATFNSVGWVSLLEVNATSASSYDGLRIQYEDGGTAFIVSSPSVWTASPAFAPLASGTDFNVRLTYDGATLTGTLTQGAMTQTSSITTINSPGGNLIVHHYGPFGVTRVDNLIGP